MRIAWLLVWLSSLLAAGMSAAAATSNLDAVEGAFGLTFAQPADTAQLQSSVTGARHWPADFSVPLKDLAPTPETSAAWYDFTPSALPPRLREAPLHYRALLGEQRAPVLIAVYGTLSDCAATADWLAKALAKKYGEADRDAGTVFRQFGGGDRTVELGCRGSQLELQYHDALATEALVQSVAARQSPADDERLRLTERMRRLELRRFADRFISHSPGRIEGAFGLLFNEPVPGLDAITPDTESPLPAGTLKAPFEDGQLAGVLDPEGRPIRLIGVFPLSATLAQRSADALEAVYGKPYKDAARHKIFRVNGNFAIWRQTDAGLRLVFVDGVAEKAARERAERQAQAAWEADTEGL